MDRLHFFCTVLLHGTYDNNYGGIVPDCTITVSSVVSNQGIYTYQYYCVPKAAVIIGTTSVHELAPAWEVSSAVKISTSVYFM